jgi:hypothetical protein
MSEHQIRTFEPRSRQVVSWWVEGEQGGHPHSFGSDEKTCRQYQAEHGGKLTVTRLTEVTYGALFEVRDE